MADGGRQDVLGQKAQAAQRAFEARGMSPAKALRRALSRSADILWDLALMGQAVQIETLDQDGVINGVGEDTLLLLLDGPEGALGLAEFDREIVTGLVEVQTIQQVTNMPADDRPFSSTDAAMMTPIIEDGLARFVHNLDGNPIQSLIDGYRFGAMLDDARTASHLLEAASYRAFRAEIDLALGRRKGRISFIFPDRKIDAAAEAGGKSNEPGPHEAEMLRVPASLDCALARISIPLSRAEQLRPGDVLELPPGALDDAELRAAKGHVAARGKLGQLGGLRALRVTWPRVKTAGPVTGGQMTSMPAAGVAEPLAQLDDFGGSEAGGFDLGGDAGNFDMGADLGSFDMGGDSEAFDSGNDAGGMGDFGSPMEGGDISGGEEAVDFAAEAAAFDLDGLGESFDGGEFDAAPTDASTDDALGGEDGFAAATLDFDIDS